MNSTITVVEAATLAIVTEKQNTMDATDVLSSILPPSMNVLTDDPVTGGNLLSVTPTTDKPLGIDKDSLVEAIQVGQHATNLPQIEIYDQVGKF